MKPDFAQNVGVIIICFVISAGGCFFIIDSMNTQATDRIEQHLASPNIGPFDEALADMVGLPHREKKGFNPLQPNTNLPDFNFEPMVPSSF